MWRAIYWAKMPDLKQRARILLDWVLDITFGRDIVLEERRLRTDNDPAARLYEQAMAALI